MNASVAAAASRLAVRGQGRTEADIQADIYVILTGSDLRLSTDDVVRLETQVGDGTRRRIDVEIGHCVIEVKRDLRPSGVIPDAVKQLAGYVNAQSVKLARRYVGILTDGVDWHLYHLEQSDLVNVSIFKLANTADAADRLLVWLESILATKAQISPLPIEIEQRLGASSPAHLLDHATLAELYEQSKGVEEVRLKRDLWSKLLRTAFGTAFKNDQALFIDHTVLVLTSEIIAHAVLGFDISSSGPLTPRALARGTEFANAQIFGVVESDFFDWVLEVPGGPDFVTELANRISRFDWSHVEHDVLKVLYESVISAETRASLGEYYTPDWLADRMVSAVVTDPLTQTVLDPACGSGTFLFHSVRAYLEAANKSGVSDGIAVRLATEHVFGMDVHPVAVILARVTYLLAIGRTKLTAMDRGPITIPVYLGDALQWEQRRDLFAGSDSVTISTAGDDLVEGAGALFGDDLIFPRTVLNDASTFDQLVSNMADKALDTSGRSDAALIRPIMRQFGIHANDESTIASTFTTMRELHKRGRNHIWGYYVRNLIRPLWLAETAHKVDVLVGNPPWLRYSKMTPAMQKRYKSLASERGLLRGRLGGSGRDLATLFVARSVELYLKLGGEFAFVMPHGTLTRRPHEGFRTGQWGSFSGGSHAVSFGEPWDLVDVPTGFPMVSCVVKGRATDEPKSIPLTVQKWSGSLPRPDISWKQAEPFITVKPGKVAVLNATKSIESAYKRRFRQGAVLSPRMLLFVEVASAGPLGAGAGRLSVVSRRTRAEKKPWLELPSLAPGSVEVRFVKNVYLGESIAPFRVFDPLKAVLPIDHSKILSAEEIENSAALSSWWEAAESIWSENKSAADESNLLDRIDFHGQLSAQVPTAAHRVVYNKAGNTLVSAVISDSSAVIDHKLYWAPTSSLTEAQFLSAVLNSRVVLERVKPLQALGLFGGRDFDKNVFSVPIPVFDGANADHSELVALAQEGATIANNLGVTVGLPFQRSRNLIRRELVASGFLDRLDAVVDRTVPQVVDM